MPQDAKSFKQKCIDKINTRLEVVREQKENPDNSDYINAYLGNYIVALEDILKDIESLEID